MMLFLTSLTAPQLSGEAGKLLPDRAMLGMVWRYLALHADPQLRETPLCLCRKIVRWANQPLDLGQLLTCLDIFRDVQLLTLQRMRKYITIRLAHSSGKADLSQSRTMQLLLQRKES